MEVLDQLEQNPHLISPAHLMYADSLGKFGMPLHVKYIDAKLVDFYRNDAARLMINIPFQHFKTTLCSVYNTAWTLLLEPELRIVLAAHSEEYATTIGSRVKDVLERWGPQHGVKFKSDTKSKGQFVISKFGGGLVCKGMHGGIQGRPADIFIIEDPIENSEQALSPAIVEKHWDWYCTVLTGRIRAHTKILIVTTRWSRNDICGRVQEWAKAIGEKWDHVKLPAIAVENDPLGRKPGEALCPTNVTLKQFQDIKNSPRGRWWNACWQQEPIDEEGAFFKPRSWPTYKHTGDAYCLYDGTQQTIIQEEDVTIMITVDWAMGERKKSDYTAMVVFGLTRFGKLLVLDVINKRLGLTNNVPTLANLCERWHPDMVCVEGNGFQASMATECRRYPSIPEPYRMYPESKPNDKQRRAFAAMAFAEGRRIYLPSVHQPWLEEMTTQLMQFTGIDDDHDDIVDCFSYACLKVNQLRGYSAGRSMSPVLLLPGKEPDPFLGFA